MNRLMHKRLEKLEAHKQVQEPVQRPSQAERDEAVRAFLASGAPMPVYERLGGILAEQRNAAVMAALRADA
jgi:hypothetical protein